MHFRGIEWDELKVNGRRLFPLTRIDPNQNQTVGENS